MLNYLIANMRFFLILSLVFLGISLGEFLQNEPETERIINGKFAKGNMFPWMVALFLNNAFHCTASLISSQHILTAAHCVRTSPSPYDNGLYKAEEFHGIIGAIRKSKGQKIKFSNITVPSGTFVLNYDIAVMKLKNKVTLSDSVQPICLATEKMGDLTWKPVIAMGWGSTSRNNTFLSISDTLKYTDLQVYPKLGCSVLFDEKKLPDGILCAGEAKTGTCIGDSGGPLVLKEGKKKPVQVGITSFFVTQTGCGRSYGPGGFVKVSSLTDYIREATDGAPCFVEEYK